MIQLNLLPDVKLEFIKAKRSRRLVFSISMLVTIAAILILVILLSVDFAQKKHLSDLNSDINSETSQLKGEPQINKILTVQNQLESMTGLHASEPAVPNLFGYLDEITPAVVAINDFTIDFTQDTATITGTADSLASVNQYVDTLKYTTYTSGSSSPTNAFSNVVLSSFGLNTSTSNTGTNSSKAASFTIDLSFDSNIFSVTQNIKLSVPTEITTRSALEQPTDLFQAAPSTSNGGN